MSKLIYLDNAATTQVYPEVLQEMLPYFSEVYSNPSAIYSFASESKKAVDKARTSVAELINAKTDEIYFTGGGRRLCVQRKTHHHKHNRTSRNPSHLCLPGEKRF